MQYDEMRPSSDDRRGGDRPESLFARDSDSTQTPHHKVPADDTAEKDTERRGQPGYTGGFGRWLTEILAYFVSLIALAAIIITLATHDGHPLPDWPFRISINALISVFAVILKATMMIPVAEGEFQVLVRAPILLTRLSISCQSVEMVLVQRASPASRHCTIRSREPRALGVPQIHPLPPRSEHGDTWSHHYRAGSGKRPFYPTGHQIP